MNHGTPASSEMIECLANANRTIIEALNAEFATRGWIDVRAEERNYGRGGPRVMVKVAARYRVVIWDFYSPGYGMMYRATTVERDEWNRETPVCGMYRPEITAAFVANYVSLIR